tara:strand:- start:785574 stop:786587 length:1014 start_codon:yes stop_codon:yes gene_type:complete
MSLDYPIKFHPILKDKIWGGQKLMDLLNKKSDRKDIGESWEVSDIKGSMSVVSNGKLKGHTLQDLMVIYRGGFLGEKVFKKFSYNFPLLLKYIDAKEALSIQLHPHDDLAKERHNSFGKTEMWYVMQADEGANLIVGFKKDTDKETYLEHLKQKSLLDILNVDPVKKGDVYFIPTGRVHAIGAGVMLAEIQQTSDITYRVYDWDRQDEFGNYRDLHTDDALEAIDYSSEKNYKTPYKKKTNSKSVVVDCKYFTTNILPVKGSVSINHSDKDSFVIYMCVHGSVNFKCGNEITTVETGETVVIPAMLKEFSIQSKNKSELLEVYIRQDSPILEDELFK